MSLSNVAAIVLAAGEASRFGSPKQLLLWRGETLVGRAIHSCKEADCSKIAVVTGAHKRAVEDAVRPSSSAGGCSAVHNPDWRAGMFTSIVTGLQWLLEQDSTLTGVYVVLVDQPRVDGTFLRKLNTTLGEASASALAYPSGAGVPALFRAELFNRLLALDGTAGGAKSILRDKSLTVNLIDAVECRQDIDTLADWNDFTSR